MRSFQGPCVCLPGAGHEGSPHEQRPAVAVCSGTTDHPRPTASSAAPASDVRTCLVPSGSGTAMAPWRRGDRRSTARRRPRSTADSAEPSQTSYPKGQGSHDVATRIKHPYAAREGCEAGWKVPDGEELAAASLGPSRHLFCARRALHGDTADRGPHGGGAVRRNSHRALHAETSSLLARPRSPARVPVRCSPNPPITASARVLAHDVSISSLTTEVAPEEGQRSPPP